MPGPVCLVCDGCSRVFGISGKPIENDSIQAEKLIASFPTSGDAYRKARAAGWSMDFPEDPDGNSFYDGTRVECPDCREDPQFGLRYRRAKLDRLTAEVGSPARPSVKHRQKPVATKTKESV